MEPIEAIDEVKYLKAMFPGTNREQEDFWYEQFQKYPKDIVRMSIYEFSERHGDFVDRPGLLTLIQSKIPDEFGISRASAEVTARLATEITASANRRAELKEQEEVASASFAAVESALASYDDAGLEELKTAAVAQASGDLRPFLIRSNPRRGPILRYIMAQFVGKVAEHVAVR